MMMVAGIQVVVDLFLCTYNTVSTLTSSVQDRRVVGVRRLCAASPMEK